MTSVIEIKCHVCTQSNEINYHSLIPSRHYLISCDQCQKHLYFQAPITAPKPAIPQEEEEAEEFFKPVQPEFVSPNELSIAKYIETDSAPSEPVVESETKLESEPKPVHQTEPEQEAPPEDLLQELAMPTDYAPESKPKEDLEVKPFRTKTFLEGFKGLKAPNIHSEKPRHLAIARYFIGILQVFVDIIAVRPIDMIIDFHFCQGKEWARLFKRISWILLPISGGLVLFYLFKDDFKEITPIYCLLATRWLFFSAAATIFWVILGTRWLNKKFKGNGSIALITFAVVFSAVLQSSFFVFYVFPYLNQSPRLIAKIYQLKPMETIASHLDIKFQKTSTSEKPAVALPERKPARPLSEIVKLRPDTIKTAKTLLRKEFPEKAKEDLLNAAALILFEQKGPQGFEGDTQQIANEIKFVLLAEFPFLLKPEVIRKEKIPLEPKIETVDKEDQSLLSETEFYNRLVVLTTSVRQRDYERIQDSLPSLLRRRISYADLGRFYLPFFTIGEIFNYKPQIMGQHQGAALVKIDYHIAPYVEIDAEKVVFKPGFYATLKQDHPVRSAEIFYLLIKEKVVSETGKIDTWHAVHFTNRTEKIIKQLYPNLEIPGQPMEPNIRIVPNLITPRKLVKPKLR